jgi:hypothetical protein
MGQQVIQEIWKNLRSYSQTVQEIVGIKSDIKAILQLKNNLHQSLCSQIGSLIYGFGIMSPFIQSSCIRDVMTISVWFR